jgi:hypothetical protein
MADVKITDYPLKECSEFPHWKLDLEELENRLTTKTKAIILISPHNPTGMVIDSQTFEAIAQIARRHALAIIYDEVFCEFLHTDECFPRGIGSVAPLVFTLNGISKMFGLPGMKLGWIAVSGDEKLVSQSVKRLEFMSDTFLPVSEPIQFALADIFANGKKHLHEVRSFLKENLHQTLKNLKGSAFLKPLTPSAGFYLPLQLNTQEADETIALELLQETGILVHPGAFYDMKGNHLILSLLQEKEKLHEGVYRLGQYFRTFL